MGEPSSDQWVERVQEAARILALPVLKRSERSTQGPHDPKFLLGDFLTSIPSYLIEKLAVELGHDAAQFRVYEEVARKLPPARRVEASWTVHRDLRDRPELLRNGLTVRQAAEIAGKKAFDSKADQRLTVAERAAKVRRFLADPEVYAVIDGELAQSRAERQLRSRVRLVHAELGKRERELEAELRSLREAKSPFEATVKAELDLNRAAQLVHAIGVTLDDLPEPDRLLDALGDLNAETIRVLAAKPTGDNNAVIDGTWQDRSARVALDASNQRILP
ncbi:hypothetical protein [Dactylosporangium sp. CS-033363]|uniref:hypothetical protein n=1 Tax=Dactylosporangium sp. CS-033363 TaxID=3239935 RepID=UPI003D8B6513